MVNVVGMLAAGDFTQTLKRKECYEINFLVMGLNSAMKSLRQLASGINEQAQTLARAVN